MTLPSSGTIGLYDVRTELGLGSVQLGVTDSNVRTLANRATGSVNLPVDFYGKSNYPPSGTYLSQYCSGYNLYYRYANGSGGYYDTLQQSNSSLCGWPPPATYQLTTSTTSVDEWYGITVTITTTYFNSGTGNGDLYWRIVHNTTTEADFSGPTSGVASITNNSGGFGFYAAADQLTEGTENFYVVVSLTPGGTAVANTSTLTINDTSQTPAISYSISAITGTVVEGGTIVLSVSTTNFGSGTLYWKIPSLFGDITSSDLDGVYLDIFYSVYVSNNSATIYIPTVLDTIGEYSPNSYNNPEGNYFSVFLYDQSFSAVAGVTDLKINEKTEVITGPNYGSPGVAYNVYITNGVPYTNFSWNRQWVGPNDWQTATLDANGAFTFSGIVYPSSPLPFTYIYPFTFAGTGRSGQYSIYIS